MAYADVADEQEFPSTGAGLDVLYEVGGAANGGGYYFMPRAAKRGGSIAQGLFD